MSYYFAKRRKFVKISVESAEAILDALYPKLKRGTFGGLKCSSCGGKFVCVSPSYIDHKTDCAAMNLFVRVRDILSGPLTEGHR